MKLSVLRSAVGLVAVPYGQALPQQRSGPGIATATSSDHPVPTDIMFLARVVSPDAPDFDGMIMGQFHPTWESSIADLWRPLPDDSNVIDWDYVFVDVDAEGEPTLFWNRVGTQYAGTVYRDKENMPLIVMDPANASEDDEEKRIKGLYTDGYGLISKLGDDKFTFTGEEALVLALGRLQRLMDRLT